MEPEPLHSLRVMAWPATSNRAVNPYNALLYEGKAPFGIEIVEYGLLRCLRGPADILHVHWPDSYVNNKRLWKSLQRIIVLGLVVIASRFWGTKLIWTVHNLEPHDAYHPALAGRFMQWFARRCDGLIFLSNASRQDFLARHGERAGIPFAIIPHGHYRAVHGEPMDRPAARERLGLSGSGRLLLMFGMLKPYKNAARLIEAFRPLANGDVDLIIAGAPASPAYAAQLKSFAADMPNVRLITGFIPDRDVATYFSAADLVVLPYRKVLNSGAALLALSFDRPLLAPRLGSFEELQAGVGAEWVHLYDDPEITTPVIEACLRRVGGKERDKCDLTSYEWNDISRETFSFYKTVAQDRRREL
jgi:beta-1,4-mannosyltransferase